MADFEPLPPPDEAEIASVFGFDEPPVAPAPAPAPAAEESGEGLGAPSPSPDSQPAPPPAEPVPAAPAPALPPLAESPAPATAQPPAPVEAPAAPTTEALTVASLTAQVQALQQQLQQQQQPQAPGTPAPSTPGTDGAPAVEFNLSVPPQLSEAIFSEDPTVAQAGISHLVNSLAKIVYTRAMADTKQLLDVREQESQQRSLQDQQQAAMAAMQQDYYGKFPAHDNPTVKHIVAAEAGKLSAEFPGLPWNEQYRDALGARVNAAIQALTGQQPPEPATPPTPPAPPARPAPFAPAGTRSAAPPTGEDSEIDLIASTFSPDFE